MKKLITLLLISVLAFVCSVSVLAADAVVISTADELSAIMSESDKWSGNYKLGADINMAGTTQRAMGNYDVPFSGTFDGDGHTVSGLNIRADGTAGLFGVISGTVKNVTVAGNIKNTFEASSAETKISGKYPGTGGIAGVALSGATVENCVNNAQVEGPGNCGGVIGVVYNFSYAAINVTGCENNGTIYSTAGNCGGVIGRVYVSSAAFPAVTVKNCVNNVAQTLSVDNRNRLGGIVGYLRSEAGVVVIENCTNKGDITAKNVGDAASNDYPYAGGIVARIEAVSDYSSAARISKCSNTAKITSGKYAGGIVTYIQRAAACGENVTDVIECINTGDVDGPRFAGGVVGYTENKCAEMTYSGIYNCANYGKVTASDYSGGILGRQYGFSVKECYNAGSATGTVAGALVGIAEGQIYCEIDKCYYLDSSHTLAIGNNKSTLTIALAMESVDASAAKVDGTFKNLDFDNVWRIGESGPTLKMLTGDSTSSNDKDEESLSPFKATRTYEGQFTDVTEDKWFYKYVKTAYEYALANGTSTTKFSPDNKFTVAQALTAAANIHSVYYGKTVRAAYQGEAWYEPYVGYCIDNGIIRFGMFSDYNKNITRGEMAIVFASILPDSEYAATRSGSNPDVTIDMACYSAVAKLFAAGIVGGDAGSGNFRPNDEIVRSEACVIFTRIALADERIK